MTRVMRADRSFSKFADISIRSRESCPGDLVVKLRERGARSARSPRGTYIHLITRSRGISRSNRDVGEFRKRAVGAG